MTTRNLPTIYNNMHNTINYYTNKNWYMLSKSIKNKILMIKKIRKIFYKDDKNVNMKERKSFACYDKYKNPTTCMHTCKYMHFPFYTLLHIQPFTGSNETKTVCTSMCLFIQWLLKYYLLRNKYPTVLNWILLKY